jgi:hypothetical protein
MQFDKVSKIGLADLGKQSSNYGHRLWDKGKSNQTKGKRQT